MYLAMWMLALKRTNRKCELIAEVTHCIKVMNYNVFKYINKDSADQSNPIFNILEISMEIFDTLKKCVLSLGHSWNARKL